MIANLWNSLVFMFRHPLVRGVRWSALLRLMTWQASSYFLRLPVIVPWVNESRLVIRKGMTGATGNYYFGLHEFSDMGFLLHFLSEEDLFLDLGANVGSYTVLAARVSHAKVIAVEPVTSTFNALEDNIRINDISSLVRTINAGLGDEAEMLYFTTTLDAENHVVSSLDLQQDKGIAVQVIQLDELIVDLAPTMIKLDVEGYEAAVIAGGERTFSLPSLRAVLIELNGSGSRYGYSDDTIRAKFKHWGFEPYSYDPLTRTLYKTSDSVASKSGNTLFLRDFEGVQQIVKTAKPFCVLGRTI